MDNLEAIKGGYAARIECWEHTRMLADAFAEPPPSYKYKHVATPPNRGHPTVWKTKIDVEDIDSIDCGLALQEQGLNPVVLNLADPSYPGGQVDFGAATQEESLFRRTNLCRTLSLKPDLYPIGDGEAIVSPGVCVFKSSEGSGWQAITPHLKHLDFIACPGIIQPKIVEGRLRPADAKRYCVKVETILQAALANGNDSIVLSALGCGAFNGPPTHIAECFKDVLTKKFPGEFKRVCFAILRLKDDKRVIHNKAFQGFENVFSGLTSVEAQ